MSRFQWISAVSALWLTLIGSFFYILTNYSSSAGESQSAPSLWPGESALSRSSQPTLVLFAHPKCPCTRSSIGELAWIMSRVKGRAKAYVLFIKPQNAESGWEKTDLWMSAAAIPGAEVRIDAVGSEVKRFRAETSGNIVVYDSVGRLVFDGGITAGRGHFGANAGRDSVLSYLLTGRIEMSATPVYGCALAAAKTAGQQI